MVPPSYLGIDPGIFGGWCFILPDGRVKTQPMPIVKIKRKNGKMRNILDQKAILHYLNSLPTLTLCCIEEQPPVRNQNVVASHTTAVNYGMLLMALAATHVEHQAIQSNDWQSYFGIVKRRKGAKGETTKQQASKIARQLYPGLDLRGTLRSRTDHDGIVDSLLLCRYGQDVVWQGTDR
jgi:hypothetical protein